MIKIAYIGGGSRLWARNLMIDLALCSDLSGNISLYDIDADSATLNEQLGNWMQTQPGVVSHWRYETVATLEESLRGADFVVLSIQPGTLECMAHEIAIAEQHGLFFPVGDTTGAPGLVRGLRSATIYEGFAHAIAKHCPNAWIINYTNPMTICTRTLKRVEPGLKVFGCCHEVFGTQDILASLVGQYISPTTPARSEIHVNVLGINHFTWVDQAEYQGHDLFELLRQHIAKPGVLRKFTPAEIESANDFFQDHCQVKFNLFKRFNIFPAAGDRHLVEFLPGFIRSPDELFGWGLIRTPVAYRIQRWKEAPQLTRDMIAGRRPLVLHSSGEQGVAQIRALLGFGDLITNVNLENSGQITNLPLAAVVETNAYFSRDQVRPLVAGALPAGLQALIHRHVCNQELIIEAALTRNKDLAFQAVYGDPSNDLPVDNAWNMFNAMLQASKAFLPGWDID